MTDRGIISLCGIADASCAPVVSHIFKQRKGPCLLITSTEIKAERLASDLSFFIDEKIYILPDEDNMDFEIVAKDHGQMLLKMKILRALCKNEKCIIIAPVCAALRKILPKDSFLKESFSIKTGDNTDPDLLKQKLSTMGYERFPVVDGPGQFSVRGDIIDIFASHAENPYRIELFDTEVDGIRSFDIKTQRSDCNLSEIEVFPAAGIIREKEVFEEASSKLTKAFEKQIKKARKSDDEELVANLLKNMERLIENLENSSNTASFENRIGYFYDNPEYIFDYMEEVCIVLDDPDRVRQTLKERGKLEAEDFKVLLERGKTVPDDIDCLIKENDIMNIYSQELCYCLSPFAKQIKGVAELAGLKNISARSTISFNGKMDLLKNEILRYVNNGFQVTVSCSSEERKDNLYDFFEREGLAGRVELKDGILSSGMEYPEYKRVWISDRDIFNDFKSRKRKRRKTGEIEKISVPVKSFADISPGDYVVHEGHGIGQFIGIIKLEVGGEQKDYLHIKYAGNDKLYVPVEQMDLIQKYSGADTHIPKINSLSGTEWRKTKAKAKAAIEEMAQDLIDLAARRKKEQGFAFSKDSKWQKMFEDSFPYAETDDQLICIDEMKADMENICCMDRLLCGDVGFGKTEVAARGLFKCVAEGKQAAVLVPTTILANQHYYTLKERFEAFPFKVEVLSRFKSSKETEEIKEKLKKGQIDLIIGTHKLLSNDVKFKDLGLLVIDEEQRFGVRHKEEIKKLKTNVDVLTLSATPIPRTLHMSMSGIRDMSVIANPPEDRYPVSTYVTEQDDYTIRTAIERELGRGGQVYVVYNRVNGISQVAQRIKKLVPEANVATGHGRMKEENLEDVMMDFMDGITNVLVSTTIIETGLDIPNVNTIIILDADRFGLSQLYQLRGRVGRTNRMAYAYLMYEPGKALTEVAQKRLKAIKDFTEFGSGFKVAMRDLEIRGAGNLLGTSQSGHMMNIGYELYCRMINDAVRKINGETVNESREDTRIEISTAAYIPDSYIGDENLKLHAYKKIADVYTYSDEEDIIEELIDRFGDIPKQVMDLIKVSRIRKLAEIESIEKITEEKGRMVFWFGEKNNLKGPVLLRMSDRYGLRILFHGGIKPLVKLSIGNGDKLEEVLKFLLCVSDEEM